MLVAFDRHCVSVLECFASVGNVVLDVVTRVLLEVSGAEVSAVGLTRKGDTCEIRSQFESLSSSLLYVRSSIGDKVGSISFSGLAFKLSALIVRLKLKGNV